MNKLIISFILLVMFNIVFSQSQKYDKIKKINNELIEVKILKLTDEYIEFVYPKEDLKITLALEQVKMITFASGRVQEFNSQEFKSQETPITSIIPNSLVVLPIQFYDKNRGTELVSNANLAQQQTIDFLMQQTNNILPLRLIDTRKANSLLKKNNISVNDLDNTAIEDLHNIVGAENIIIIKVAYTLKRSNSSFNSNNKEINFGMTDEDINYDYEIAMDIYKNNEIIYKKTRVPFWNFKDSWLDAVKYLLERAPFYHD